MVDVNNFNGNITRKFRSIDPLVCNSGDLRAKTVRNVKGYLKFQITDTGDGIARDQIHKIFNMFGNSND